MSQHLHLWIDDAGNRLPVADLDVGVRAHLGMSAEDLPQASEFATRNLGWVGVTFSRHVDSTVEQLALRYDSVRAEPSALDALAILVKATARGSPRVKLRLATQDGTALVPVGRFLDEQLPHHLDIARRRAWHPAYEAEQLPLDLVAEREDSRRLSELLARWRQTRDYGVMMPLLMRPSQFAHSGVITVDGNSFRVGWIGPSVGIYKREKLIGRNLLDQPDAEYSSRLVSDYADIVARGQPRLSRVRATIEGRRYAYLRLVLPCYSDAWRADRATELISSHVILKRS